MRILITGVAGFIGFHLAKKLIEQGHEIVGIDNINDYYTPTLKRLRLSELDSKKFKFYESDINKIDNFDQNFDLVINLAAQAGVRIKKEQEINYINSNIYGFKNICNFCSRNKIKRIIYASSSSVYDDSNSEPFSESKTLIKPKSVYGMSKLFNEVYASAFASENNMSFLGLRLFSVYGPYGRPDMAYFSFTDSIKRDEVVRLHNDGSMARDMTYIDDVIEGISASIDYLIKEDLNGRNEIFNLGNNSPIMTSFLLNSLKENLNIEPKVKRINTSNESVFTHANLSKSKRILGYNPKTSFEDGIKEFLNWHKTYENL
tara:strand:- start:23195 stop:24145 length:951 start_codon:yes stop_codon:yes gene_type:complete